MLPGSSAASRGRESSRSKTRWGREGSRMVAGGDTFLWLVTMTPAVVAGGRSGAPAVVAGGRAGPPAVVAGGRAGPPAGVAGGRAVLLLGG